MDTTIQGTAGLMDLTCGGNVPYKVGISISDLLGGQFALLAILAGLEYRERTGRGQAIDLSMQELSAWLTQFFWNEGGDRMGGRLCACGDGYVYVEGPDMPDAPDLRQLTRAQAAELLNTRGMRSAPVHTVSEVAGHPQTVARGLIAERPSRNGIMWPLLASPIRITPHSPEVRRAFGAVGEDFAEVSADWGFA
jgi:crotonobetainyl-CoA:carnitine CoA-transferase CaiB-like acyl-CoA transferase